MVNALAIGCGLAAVLALVWVVRTYNALVRYRNQVETNGAQIDVQLLRRHDLVPNLVAAVTAVAAHERETFEAVTSARGDAVAAIGGARPAQAEAEASLGRGIGRILAIAEHYPALRATENFAGLQADLAQTENRIAHARQFYNGAAQSLNVAVATFPSRLVAAVFGFRAADYFEAGVDDRLAPVRF